MTRLGSRDLRALLDLLGEIYEIQDLDTLTRRLNARLEHIYRKLGVENRIAAVRLALGPRSRA